jgi:predicted nucleic acid-binding protein
MVIALDTNILLSLWYSEDLLNSLALQTLENLDPGCSLVISAPVYAELWAGRGSTLDSLLEDEGVTVDWELPEPVWRVAASAYRDYALRRRSTGVGHPRRSTGAGHPRRILADFLIGAHALVNGYTLLTLDQRHYRKAFPKLKLQKI